MVGEETLKRLSHVDNYNRWIFEKIKPYLGKRILEVGCGIGTMTKFFLNKELLISIDNSDKYVKIVNPRFSRYKNFTVFKHDICSNKIVGLKKYNFDTVICLNVLEHIKDDIVILKNVKKILAPGGRLILLVPAVQKIYGTLDKALDHYRRYEKLELEDKLRKCGFLIQNSLYMNIFGMMGWFLNNRLLRRTILSERQLKIYNRLVPLFRKIEEIIKPPIGQSLLCICSNSKE